MVRRYRLYKIPAAILTAAMLLTSGCATHITVSDRVPRDSPKGWVEFYFYRADGGETTFTIYKIQDGSRKLLGKTSPWTRTDEKVGLRVAQEPGTYTFLATCGTARETFDVTIPENMVTPVHLLRTNPSTASATVHYGTISVTRFQLTPDIQTPTPLDAYLGGPNQEH